MALLQGQPKGAVRCAVVQCETDRIRLTGTVTVAVTADRTVAGTVDCG